MIKELIILNIIIYLFVAYFWYLIFTYQFTLKARIKVAGEILEKDMKGLELAVLCMLWIIFIPFSIKNLFKKNNDEE